MYLQGHSCVAVDELYSVLGPLYCPRTIIEKELQERLSSVV